jgi:cytochrome c556
MKINRLILKNIRSHRTTELSFSRINIIRGDHGSGKTTIQLAIELLLTGKCDRTDQAGRGAHHLISAGGSEMTIDAMTDKAELVYRRNGIGGQLIAGQHAGKSAYAWLEANYAPIPVLSAVLNSGRFLQMDEREQKSLLAGALAADPVQFDPEIIKLIGEVTVYNRTAATSAVDVDDIHKFFFSVRTETNRDLNNLGEITPPVKPEGMPNRLDVTDQLAGLRAQRDEKVREREKELATFKGRRERLQAAQAQLKQHEANVLETAELETLNKQAKTKAKVKKLDDAIESLQADLRGERNELAALKSPTSDTCPTCGQKVATADHSEMIKKLEAAIQSNEAALEKTRGERNKMPDPEIAQKKLDAHFASLLPYQRAETTIKEVGELGTEPDVTTITDEITELEDRITKGETIERECVAYEAKVQQHSGVVQKAAKLESKVELLNKIVEYFSDRGPLKAKLIGGKVPAFVERINQVLARFGFDCNFDPMTSSLAFAVDPPPSHGAHRALRLDQLSESEQFRFGIAFQIALAEATGVNFVVIDRSDMLLPMVRQQLAQALEESNLEQAIVLCAGEPLILYPEIEGLTFFELTNEAGSTSVTIPNAAYASHG